jgi:hypothetical protein
MKNLFVCSLLVLMFVLTGCPVSTKNSIDNGSYDVPSWLAGKWCEIDSAGNTKDCYKIENGTQKGKLTYWELDAKGAQKDMNPRPMVLSKIKDRVFLSAYVPGDGTTEDGYYLFEFRKVSNSEFLLAGIREHSIDEDAEQADIAKYIEKNMNDKSLFPKEEISRYKKK